MGRRSGRPASPSPVWPGPRACVSRGAVGGGRTARPGLCPARRQRRSPAPRHHVSATPGSRRKCRRPAVRSAAPLGRMVTAVDHVRRTRGSRRAGHVPDRGAAPQLRRVHRGARRRVVCRVLRAGRRCPQTRDGVPRFALAARPCRPARDSTPAPAGGPADECRACRAGGAAARRGPPDLQAGPARRSPREVSGLGVARGRSTATSNSTPSAPTSRQKADCSWRGRTTRPRPHPPGHPDRPAAQPRHQGAPPQRRAGMPFSRPTRGCSRPRESRLRSGTFSPRTRGCSSGTSRLT